MPDLRWWLWKHGYRILEERLCREGDTLYTAFSVRAGEIPPLAPAELYAGKNTNTPLRGEWLQVWTDRAGRALGGLAQARGEEAGARRRETEELLDGLRQMREEWEQWQQ